MTEPVHSFDDDDGPVSFAERQRATRRSTWVSVVVNVVLTGVQLTVGLWTHSQALVADAIHSLSDLVSDFVVLVAAHFSAKDADADHPYGHHRYENAASLALGVILLAVGVGMIGAAATKLQATDPLPPVQAAALWVALTALVGKELLFRYMLAVAKRVKSGLLVANAWHARSDAASSLVVAVGIAGNLLGYPMLDPVAALIVGFMVAKMGWQFGWDALHDLMDRAADDDEVDAIRQTLLQSPGVRGVHDLHTRKMGDMILADVHLEVDAHLTVEASHHLAAEARARVMQRHRVLNLLTHVDPWQKPDEDHQPEPDQAASSA